MQKLYVAMVGLPARGKSTLAKRIRDGLVTEGIAAKLFNNGDMRRALIGAESTDPNFYDPNNKLGRDAREMICMRNMEIAREWLAKDGEGASKLLECVCSGAPTKDTAIIVAKEVIGSTLFKCAMFGEDASGLRGSPLL